MKVVGSEQEPPKPELSEKAPKEPCLGPDCTKQIFHDAPWGRISLGDGKCGGVCGSACNDAFYASRWKGKFRTEEPAPLMDAAD